MPHRVTSLQFPDIPRIGPAGTSTSNATTPACVLPPLPTPKVVKNPQGYVPRLRVPEKMPWLGPEASVPVSALCCAEPGTSHRPSARCNSLLSPAFSRAVQLAAAQPIPQPVGSSHQSVPSVSSALHPTCLLHSQASTYKGHRAAFCTCECCTPMSALGSWSEHTPGSVCWMLKGFYSYLVMGRGEQRKKRGYFRLVHFPLTEQLTGTVVRKLN